MNISEITISLKQLVGQPCCRQRVNNSNLNMLSLGFGEKIYHNKPDSIDNYYGQWELGTFSSAWRVVSNDIIILGSSDKYWELDEEFQKIQLGKFVGFKIDKFNISVLLDNKITIDFFPIFAEDEVFHIFLPKNNYIEFKTKSGWSYGKSNIPWKPTAFNEKLLP